MSVMVLLVCGWLSGMSSGTMTDPVLVRGFAAVEQNPAALALPGSPKATLEYFSFQVRPRMSVFNVGDYGRYFRNPVFLGGPEKQTILDRIGNGPVRLDLGTGFRALRGTFRSFGVGVNYESHVFFSVPRDAFDLALNGNEMDRTYVLDGLGADTLSYLRVSAGAGFPVCDWATAGVTGSWLSGTRYAHTVSSTGELLTTPTEVTGFIHQLRSQAAGGDGFGVTLGAAAHFGPWRFGVSARDMLAGIWWHRNPGTREMTMELDSLSFTRYYEQPEFDSLLVRDDQFRSGPTVWTRVPGVLAFGAGFAPFEVLRTGLMVNIPLGSSPFVPEPLLAAARLELRPLRAIGIGFLAGWHRRNSWVGRVSVGSQLRGLEMTAAAEMQGPSLSGVSDLSFEIGLGYEF